MGEPNTTEGGSQSSGATTKYFQQTKNDVGLEFSKYREKLTMGNTSEADSVWFKEKELDRNRTQF